MKIFIFYLVICLSLFGTSLAQEKTADFPIVGSVCPDFFLKDVHYYKKGSVELRDFKGKWLVLYFWNAGLCSNGWCNDHFSMMNKLQVSFQKDIQFLFVGYTGSQYAYVASEEKFVRESFENARLEDHPDLPIAYDSSLFHRFDIGACPYLVIIDPKGVVRGITDDLKKETLNGFLKGGHPTLAKAYRTHEEGSFYMEYKKKEFPEVGKLCPDFEFGDIKYGSRRSMKLSDFRGKWLVIDCWHKWCTGCIASFPATDSMQRRFGDSVRFLLVGNTGTVVRRLGPDDKEIRKLYEVHRQRDHLNLPVAYDSTFFRKNDIGACPYIIIVDPSGIVKAITDQVKEKDMYAFLHGEVPTISKAHRTHEEGNPHMKLSPVVEKNDGMD